MNYEWRRRNRVVPRRHVRREVFLLETVGSEVDHQVERLRSHKARHVDIKSSPDTSRGRGSGPAEARWSRPSHLRGHTTAVVDDTFVRIILVFSHISRIWNVSCTVRWSS